MTRPMFDDDKQYRLVFPGNFLPGTDFDEMIFDLSRLLKTSPDSAVKLVSGKRKYVKQAFVYEKAVQLRAQILQLGVECVLELVEDSTSSSKSKKNKRRKSFPRPENFAMQPAISGQKSAQQSDRETDQESGGEKSYSETMAEFEKHATASRVQAKENEELAESAFSFNAEEGQEQAESLDRKSASLNSLRRRLAQFVGENIDNYLPKFDKFQQGGTPHFVFTWHWPAFFVPFFWAIYRKLWGWSIVMFISLIFLPLLSNILWGAAANYLYYQHALQKIMKMRKQHSSDEIDELISKSGGTSNVALSVALIVILLLMNGVYWTSKLSPVFSTLNENLEKIEQTKSQQQ